MKQERRETVETSRRGLLRTLVALGAIPGVAGLPRQWKQPVVDAVLLPAHAQTSESESGESEASGPEEPQCEQNSLSLEGELSWEDDDGDEVTLTINPGFDGAAGSASVNDDGSFQGTLGASGGTCDNGEAVTQDGTFQGTLNTTTGAVSGSFTHRILCGGVVICTSSGDFSGTAVFDTQQDITLSSVESECCPDDTPVFGEDV